MPSKNLLATAARQVEELRARTDRTYDAAALLALARETTSSPALRYAAAHRAMELAAASGDVAVAISSIDEIHASFDVDLLNLRLEMLQVLAKSPRSPSAGILAMRWRNEACLAGRVDVAERLASIIRECQASLTQSLQVTATDHLEDQAAARRAAGGALASPTAPLYQCLYQQRWSEHLAALAASGGPLATLAQTDLDAADVAAKMSAAEAWWTHAATLEGLQSWRIAARAVQIYTAVLPSINGIERELAIGRMAEHQRAALAGQGLLPGAIREVWRDGAKSRSSDIAADVDLARDETELPKSNGHVRFRGVLLIEAPGRHELIFTGGSAMRVTIDGIIHIDDSTAYTKRSGIKLPLKLDPGLHPFEFEVSSRSSTPRLTVQWLTPGNYNRRPIPASALFHDSLLLP